MWSIHPVYCENVTFKNVTVNSGADGIDVDSCKHMVIDGCTFETSDDCISLKIGRGEEANTINRPCEDVRIRTARSTIGFLPASASAARLRPACSDVVVEHCKCVGARTPRHLHQEPAGTRRIMLRTSRVNDMEVSGAKQGFLRLNNLNSGKQDEFPVPGDAGIPEFRNFRFSNIRVTDDARAGAGDGDSSAQAAGRVFADERDGHVQERHCAGEHEERGDPQREGDGI